MRANAFKTWDESYNAEKNYKLCVDDLLNL